MTTSAHLYLAACPACAGGPGTCAYCADTGRVCRSCRGTGDHESGDPLAQCEACEGFGHFADEDDDEAGR